MLEKESRTQTVMTPDPECCLTTDTVEKAAQTMKRRDVGSVPVVENMKSKRLVGMITDRDIAIKVVAEGRDAVITPIGQVMERQLVTCHVHDDLDEVLDAMSEHQLRRIPIVDDEGALRGIVAQADVATRLGSAARTGEVVRDISR